MREISITETSQISPDLSLPEVLSYKNVLTAIMEDVRVIAPHLISAPDRFSTDQEAATRQIRIPLWSKIDNTEVAFPDANPDSKKKLYTLENEVNLATLDGSGTVEVSKTRLKGPILEHQIPQWQDAELANQESKNRYQFEIVDGILIGSQESDHDKIVDREVPLELSNWYIPEGVSFRSIIENYKHWRQPRVEMILNPNKK